MTGKRVTRWQAPITVIIGGSIIALAVGIGHGWSKALITEVAVVVLAGGYYLLTGGNSDLSAIYGARADERQHLVYLRASATALRVMLGAAFVCAVITIALKESYWQSDVIGSVGGVAFLLCLATFGDGDTTARDSEYAMRDETVREADGSRREHDK